MSDKELIIDKLKSIKTILSTNFGVEEIGLFGSYIRDEQNPGSDIDLLISFNTNRTITLFTLVDLEDFLKEHLQHNIHIALKKSLKKRIKQNILKAVQYI